MPSVMLDGYVGLVLGAAALPLGPLFFFYEDLGFERPVSPKPWSLWPLSGQFWVGGQGETASA